MIEATLKKFSISLASAFSEVLPLQEAGLEQIAKKALRRFGGYGLRPLEVSQREGDRLFDYETNFSLFNRNGLFRVNAENVIVTFDNAQNEQDLGIISDCLAGIFECLSERQISGHKLDTYVHVALASEKERNMFLEGLCENSKGLPIQGCILYFSADEHIPNSRLQVDRSLAWAEAVFLNWMVHYSTLEELLTKALPDFKKLFERLGLQFAKSDQP